MDKVIIIGAGPAGLSAAITLAKHHKDVTVIDEYLEAGGRLLGQLYEESNGKWWNGMKESKKLVEEATQLGVTIHLNEPVFDIEKIEDKWIIYTNKRNYTSKNILIATGAAEKPFSIPGWTLPGVMSVGAAQIMTNVHRVKPGNKGIIIGIDVLASAIAMELKIADIDVEAIALPASSKTTSLSSDPLTVMDSLLHVSHMAPSKFIQYGSKLMKNDFFKKCGIQFYPKKGVKMWDIPVMLRQAVIEIYGDEVVEGVKVAIITKEGHVIPGTEKKISVDFVCIAGGLYPLAELVALTGSPFYNIPELGGHVPLHNEEMETSVKGLYVAGNITGIEGAKVAISQGKVAALSILQQLNNQSFRNELDQAKENVRQERIDAYIQFHPRIDKGKEKMQAYWENQYIKKH